MTVKCNVGGTVQETLIRNASRMHLLAHAGPVACSGMSNVLSDDKRQQIVALGRLGWSLRRIEQVTGVRRETASAYVKAVGIQVRGLVGCKRQNRP